MFVIKADKQYNILPKSSKWKVPKVPKVKKHNSLQKSYSPLVLDFNLCALHNLDCTIVINTGYRKRTHSSWT